MSVWENMVLPFRRKDKDGGKIVNAEDEDINALLDADSQENPVARTNLPEPSTLSLIHI